MADNPGLSPADIGALSIARRLQDPLAEYVKIEPKNLGVGMYQHDVSETKLKKNLEEIVVECVSFVGECEPNLAFIIRKYKFLFLTFAGVDLNHAPAHILRRVSGLGPVTAKAIVEWRKTKAPQGKFTTKEQLRKVKGIGEAVFKQCSGFLRISASASKQKTEEPLDSLMIHPESYALAKKMIESEGLKGGDVGSETFTTHFKKLTATVNGGRGELAKMSGKFYTDEDTLKLILEVSELQTTGCPTNYLRLFKRL